MRTGIRKTGTRSCRQFCLRRATSRTAKKRPKSTRSPAEGCIHLLHPNFSAQSSRCDATMHRAVMIALHAALTRASLSRLIFQPGRGFQELGGIVRHEVQAQTRHVMPRPVCQPPTFRSRRFGPRLGGDKLSLLRVTARQSAGWATTTEEGCPRRAKHLGTSLVGSLTWAHCFPLHWEGRRWIVRFRQRDQPSSSRFTPFRLLSKMEGRASPGNP